MFDSFPVTLDVTVRLCRREDLADLEWFGMYTPHRLIFQEQFERQQKNENLILVAEANGFPIGRLWIDLVRHQATSTGLLWSLEVLTPFRNMSIGTRLIAVAETILRDRGYRNVEIGVEKINPDARRLYERLGYQLVGDNHEEWDYVTPEGRTIHSAIEEWILHKKL